MAPENQDFSPQPKKRRRVAESCKICRAKKTRCDGQRPQCSPCGERGLACEYSDTTGPVDASILSDMEMRIRKLEQTASVAHITVSNALEVSPSEQLSSLPRRSTLGAPELSDASSTGGTAGLDLASEHLIVDLPTTRFIRDIAQMRDDQSPRQNQASLPVTTNSWSMETDISAMVVPDRPTADTLVLCYEQYVHPLFPLLHMPTFRQYYELLWQPQDQQARFESLASKVTFYAILNMVFALGCLNSSHIQPQFKLRTANVFYRRTRGLLPMDALDFPSIGMVQCLLLTAIYLSCTKYFNRCCNTLAVAIRVAQAIGLHLAVEPTSNDQLTREMNKRVWCHCLSLERLYPVIYGRKLMLDPVDDLLLPDKIDDEYLLKDGSGVQPRGIPSLLDAFIITIQVFQVVDKACEMNYASFTQNSPRLELSQVLQLNEKVDEIERALPSHLKPGNDFSAYGLRGQVLQLQATGVRSRILHLRLIVLRPSILLAARHAVMPWESGSIPSRTDIALRMELSRTGVQAAVDAIDVLHSNLGSASLIFSSLAIYVTLSAATVIVAASLVPELHVAIDGSDKVYANAIYKAFEVLNEHQWQNEGAAGATDQLKGFIDTAKQAKSRASARNQRLDPQSQEDSLQLPSDNLETLGDINFSDPLWDLSWSGLCSSFNMPNSPNANFVWQVLVSTGSLKTVLQATWPAEAQQYWTDVPVSAGDVITVTVTASSNTGGRATLENKSNGRSGSYTWTGESPALCEGTAEWIVEDFSTADGMVAFADYGSVTFTGSSAVVGGATVGLDDANIAVMVSKTNIISSGSISGNDIIVTYQ